MVHFEIILGDSSNMIILVQFKTNRKVYKMYEGL